MPQSMCRGGFIRDAAEEPSGDATGIRQDARGGSVRMPAEDPSGCPRRIRQGCRGGSVRDAAEDPSGMPRRIRQDATGDQPAISRGPQRFSRACRGGYGRINSTQTLIAGREHQGHVRPTTQWRRHQP